LSDKYYYISLHSGFNKNNQDLAGIIAYNKLEEQPVKLFEATNLKNVAKYIFKESIMDQEKLGKFKESLLNERNELMKDLMISNENFANLDNVKVGDLVDQASNFYEKELAISLSTTEKETLKSIDMALARIKDSTYGLCESCNDPIDENRLEAIPYATLCLECKKNSKNNKIKNEDNLSG